MAAKWKPWATAGVMAAMLGGSAMADESLPSDDFLEYLAQLVDDDGEWVDPLTLENGPDDIESVAASDELETHSAEEKL
ncbi:MAG: hypothetical protein AAF465_14560 [Pseudomonadota bacterium]